MRRRSYRAGLIVTRNFAVPVFALVSDAEHLTSVRPTLNRLPDLGVHEAVTAPSTASFAVTLYVTRTLFAPFGARTVFGVAPASVGGVTSNSTWGAMTVPIQVSVPRPPLSERSTRPLPVPPSYEPVPPVIVKSCGMLRAGSMPIASSGAHSAPSASAKRSSPFPATSRRPVVASGFETLAGHWRARAETPHVVLGHASESGNVAAPCSRPAVIRARQFRRAFDWVRGHANRGSERQGSRSGRRGRIRVTEETGARRSEHQQNQPLHVPRTRTRRGVVSQGDGSRTWHLLASVGLGNVALCQRAGMSLERLAGCVGESART